MSSSAADAACIVPRLPGVVVRPLDAARDFPGLADLVVATAASRGLEWAPTAEEMAHEWLTTPGFEPARDARVAELDGAIVGSVALDWRRRASGVVAHKLEVWSHPRVQGRGLGRALIAWGEARSLASIAEGTGGPADMPHVVDGIGHLGDLDSEHLAASLGYAPARYFFEMRRPLDAPIPDRPLPEGLEVRPVLPDQHRAIWAADCEAFEDHWDAAARSDEDFDGMFAHPSVDPGLWQVAWDGDEVAGSVMTWILAEENARLGVERAWLEHVSVRRPWRGRGLASALIVRTLRHLQGLGMEDAALGVDAANPTGALRLYESLGFRAVRTAILYRKPLWSPRPGTAG
jgi:mycothiol synthase